MTMRTTATLTGIDEHARTASVLASTPDAIEGEALATWDVDRFLKNPIVLREHDTTKPIGTASDVRATPEGLAMVIHFATKNADAEETWQLVRQGVLKTVSVGYNPGTAHEEERDGKKVKVYSANELLELSVVSVPKDEDALIDAPASPSDAGRALAQHRHAKHVRVDGADDADVLHLDHGSLGKVRRTQVGGARIDARLSRVGVLEYRTTSGGTRRELRLPEEVFHPDSLSTLHGAPVIDIDDHNGMVTPETWRKVSLGHTENVREDEKHFIAGELVVQDGDTLGRIDRRERTEISCGYVCRLDVAPGEWNGQPYDVIQRRIRYNHVALCPPNRGRAGPSVGLRLDAAEWSAGDFDMKTIRLDGKDFEFGSDAHLAKVEDMHRAELAVTTKKLDEVQGRLDAAGKALAKADEEAEKSRAAAGDKEKEDEKKFVARVKTRLRLLRQVDRLFGKKKPKDDDDDDDDKEEKHDAMSEREIMLLAIKQDAPEFNDEGKSDDYVRSRFDALLEHTKRAGGVDSVVRAAEDATRRLDAGDLGGIVEKARAKHKEAVHNAWKHADGGAK